jgi:hypothetical protein
LASLESFFSSSTLRVSSATRAAASFFSVSFDSRASAALAAPPPALLRVSLSGVGAAAGLRSSTAAWTCPLD